MSVSGQLRDSKMISLIFILGRKREGNLKLLSAYYMLSSIPMHIVSFKPYCNHGRQVLFPETSRKQRHYKVTQLVREAVILIED